MPSWKEEYALRKQEIRARAGLDRSTAEKDLETIQVYSSDIVSQPTPPPDGGAAKAEASRDRGPAPSISIEDCEIVVWHRKED